MSIGAMDIDKCQDKTSLLHLNEHIMYSVFGYFSEVEIYLVLRKISTKFKYISTNYVQLVGMFLLANLEVCNDKPFGNTMAIIFHVFRRNYKLTTIYALLNARYTAYSGL